jgi:copper transport protein
MSRFASGILYIGASSLVTGLAVAADDPDNFFTHLHTEKAMANVTVSPGRAGPVDITIQLETTDELPLIAKAISVTLSNAQSGVDLQPLAATHTRDDQWHVRTPMLIAGRWTLGLGISISDTDKVNVESPILIK